MVTKNWLYTWSPISIYVRCLFMFIWYWGKYKFCVYPKTLSNPSIWMARPSKKEGLTNCIYFYHLWYPIPRNLNTSRSTAVHNDPWFFSVETLVIISFIFYYRQLLQPYLSANIICTRTPNMICTTLYLLTVDIQASSQSHMYCQNWRLTPYYFWTIS